jgi:hypothetical protein
MQYVFTLTNALQGCLIFYCHILLKGEGRLAFIAMKRRLAWLASGSLSSSKKSTVTRGLRKQTAIVDGSTESSKARPHCAWLTTKGLTHATDQTSEDMSKERSIRRVADVTRVCIARPTEFDNLCALSGGEMVYDSANNAAEVHGSLQESPKLSLNNQPLFHRNSSKTDITIHENDVGALPIPIRGLRRSHSYSTAINGGHTEVATDDHIVRLSSSNTSNLSFQVGKCNVST